MFGECVLISQPEDFCKNLATPRKVILLARPGSSIDRNMQKILPHLEVPNACIVIILERRYRNRRFLRFCCREHTS